MTRASSYASAAAAARAAAFSASDYAALSAARCAELAAARWALHTEEHATSFKSLIDKGTTMTKIITTPLSPDAVTPTTVYVLKCINEEGKAYGGFEYPTSGRVEAPDWSPSKECGFGLHGWVRGEGDYVHTGSIWLVLAVDTEEGFVSLDDKCKFRACTVVHYGTHESAVAYLFSVTTTRNPGVTCLSPKQCVVVARRAADRAQGYANAKASGSTQNFAAAEQEAHRRDKCAVLGLPVE